MPVDGHDGRLAYRFLEAAITELEQEAGRGSYNASCIRAAASVAKLLGEQALLGRALPLLHRGTEKRGWAPDVLQRMRSIWALAKLEQWHRPYREEELLARVKDLAKEEPHFGFCLEGRFEEACQRFGSGQELQEIAATLALLGDCETALRFAHERVPPNRRKGVLLVVIVELWRRGQVDRLTSVLAEAEAMGLDAWDRLQLALGFAGREPWKGYPYPDF